MSTIDVNSGFAHVCVLPQYHPFAYIRQLFTLIKVVSQILIPAHIPTMTSSLYILLHRINRSLFACIPYFLFILWMTQSPSATASGDHEGEIRYQAQKRAFDEPWQHHLRRTTHWSRFYAQHPSWHVVFNEGNSKPHRAVLS